MVAVKEHEGKLVEFWKKWASADEIEQLKMIDTLMLPSRVIKDEKLYRFHCASIINSYLDDLFRVLISLPEQELTELRKPYED